MVAEKKNGKRTDQTLGEVFPPAIIQQSGEDPKGRRKFYGRDDF